mmetsp:Transcript_15655/g.49502  ORF Transcript_15655/g.49502 Transcript_15655/m.49502 type:complete len:369 (+) Transcript_15655:64-1170(+)
MPGPRVEAVASLLRPLSDVDEVYVDYVLTSIEEGGTLEEIQELLQGICDGRKDGQQLEQQVMALLRDDEQKAPAEPSPVNKVLRAPIVAADFNSRPATLGEAVAPAEDEAPAPAEKKQAKRRAKPKDKPEGQSAPLAQQVVITSQQTRFDANYGKNGYSQSALQGIDITGLDITVGSRSLLSEAHLQLFPGRYGFIGPNGAGKTTLLRAMAQRQIPGYPPGLTVLVEQEDVGDERSPLEAVVGACEELSRLRTEEACLQAGLDDGRPLAAALEVELGRQRRERAAAELRSKQLSGQRGDAADAELLRAEHAEKELADRLAAAKAEARPPEPQAAEEAEARCAALLEGVRQQLLLPSPPRRSLARRRWL